MAKLRTKINKGLINILSPTCVKINRNNFEYGENIARIYGITKYPQTTPTGFLSKITNIPKTFVNIHYRPVANNVITAAINRNTRQNMEQQATSREMNELKEASISIENMNDLLEMLLRDNERMGQVSVNIMGLSKEEDTFEQVENSINDNVASISSINRALPNLQKQCLESISPTYQMDERINEIYGKVMPLSTFIGGFPFASTGFNDGQGYYLAKDVNNSLIIIADAGFDPSYGARPLKRAVTRMIEDPVSEFIITDRMLHGKEVTFLKELRVGVSHDRETTTVSVKED